jgi:flagellar protein FliL
VFDMSKTEKTETEAAPAKGKKKKLLMIVAIALIAVAGGAGYMMLGGGGGDKAEAEEAKPEAGPVVALDAITINLTDGHFLKLKLSLQATAEVHEEPDGSKALDLAIDQFSEYAMGELSSAEGRHKAKDELREHLVEAYEHEVMDVYFTEFVMQ